MANTIIVGMQWGDEGKGKIVDLLCPNFQVVVRFQGGNNAGHTVKFADQHFSLHLIPSGILHPETRCVLANGMVIDPMGFLQELDGLLASGIEVEGRLFISDRAHVILPYHATLDRLREAAAGKKSIGTTARGIGPCYESKISRSGLRVADFFSSQAEERIAQVLSRLNSALASYGESIDESPSEVLDQARTWMDRLEPWITDTSLRLHEWMSEGSSLLFEGAQGALLDIDHGTYPYVTSSNASSGGACTGSGVPANRIDGVIGVLKAYTTRVGKGPMVVELHDDQGEFLRQRGHEFGTTTGRPRRCGWFDVVAARYGARINGVDVIALTKLDVLDDFEEIPICVGYRVGDEVFSEMPADPAVQEVAEPVLEVLPGWQSKTVGIENFEDLPPLAQKYVETLEGKVGVPVGIVSTGPRREETIIRSHPNLEKLLA